jgi:hypothetical protein
MCQTTNTEKGDDINYTMKRRKMTGNDPQFQRIITDVRTEKGNENKNSQTLATPTMQPLGALNTYTRKRNAGSTF